MAEDDPPVPEAAADTVPTTRVVTHEGRRTSVRLEPVFWRALARIARRQGVRVGPLIGRIGERHRGNLTARLRALCMLDAERRIAAAQADDSPASLLRVVRAAPVPALFIGPETQILDANAAFDGWLGTDTVRGLDLGELFQIRTAPRFRDIWAAVQRSGRPVGGIGLLYIAEGRVTAAEATLVPLPAAGDDGSSAIVWISTRGHRARKPARGAPDAQPSSSTKDASGG